MGPILFRQDIRLPLGLASLSIYAFGRRRRVVWCVVFIPVGSVKAPRHARCTVKPGFRV